MKKFLLGSLIVCLIIAGLVGNFYYYDLRGAGPAINPPPRDITREIPPASPEPAKNTTGLPIKIPNGFAVSIFAKNLGDARVMTWDTSGNLLVSVPGKGRVMALTDTNGDGVADGVVPVISGLTKPHGLAFHDGKLYIAEMNQVAMYEYDASTKKASNKKKIIDLPSGGNHTSRTIGFGPDGKLYIAVGSSCNVCVEKDKHRAAISVANADGSGYKVFASGLRNTVFFTWQPDTRQLWGTDMGRDFIGDDVPPEEINIIKEGKDYGWPYCYHNKVHDGSFDPRNSKVEFCTTTVAPHITFQAHSAPLGLAFTPKGWPKEYQNNLLVSFHGSWNRSDPTGYKIVRFTLDAQGNSLGFEDFISGWLTGDGALGRPVDLIFDAKGVLYISDDKAGIIYRVSRM